jgi:hypothetical protein
MLLETDTTTQEVLTMYGFWFAFILLILAILFKGKKN